MFGSLSGTVQGTRGKSLILEVGGIGYLVAVNQRILRKAQTGSSLALRIHTHQTSETISLFGFENEKDLAFFELLLTVNGVGPKTALEIMETPVEVVENAIVGGDTAAFRQIPGVGPKTAGRIVLELKGKLTGNREITLPNEREINSDVYDALEQLGYKKNQIDKTLAALSPELVKTEEIVKWFLRQS